VTTAIVSDLHLGPASERDLLRRPAALEALTSALEEADQVVLLGDVLELRERPIRQVLAAALPVLRAIGGRPITLVPGNHDHRLAQPFIDSSLPLGLENFGRVPLTELEEALGGNVRLAYPGVWVRPDVYATHGHYLDVHNTVPSFERLSIGATRRLTRAGEPASPADYETAIGLVNAVTYALAQAARKGPAVGGSGASVRLWHMANGNSSGRLPKLLLTRLAIPGTVALLNRAGLGPLKPDLSAIELREAALRGMHEVTERLAIDAPHVIFGHTHRSGPHPGDEGWGPLMNTGSWIHEPAFLGREPKRSPYWPGHVVIVPDEGPPELRSTLDELPV
jgi:UDP-2,3-diacylglucosamine pyrophosphatase LpxH